MTSAKKLFFIKNLQEYMLGEHSSLEKISTRKNSQTKTPIYIKQKSRSPHKN